jgi:hypothetical protein
MRLLATAARALAGREDLTPELAREVFGRLENAQARMPALRVATEKLIERVLEDLTGVEAEWLGGAKPWFNRLIQLAQDPMVSDAQFTAAIESARNNIPQHLAPLLKPDAVARALEGAMGAACVNGAVRGFAKRKIGNPSTLNQIR